MSNSRGLLSVSDSNNAKTKKKAVRNCDITTTVQMAQWYRASASGSVDLGFDSESDQTNGLKIGIHNFPA